MPINKASILEAYHHFSHHEIRYFDVRYHGSKSSLFSTPVDEETIWFLRSKREETVSLSHFWLESYSMTEDADLIEEEMLLGSQFSENISRNLRRSFDEYLKKVNLQQQVNSEIKRYYTMLDSDLEYIILGEGELHYVYFFWRSTA